MSDFHKDSLEQFFRKKAGEYEIPYQEEDWLKLKEKLEIRKMQRAYQKRVQRMAAAALLLIGILSYFTYENFNQLSRIDQYVRTFEPSDTGVGEPPEETVPDPVDDERDISPEESEPSAGRETTPYGKPEPSDHDSEVPPDLYKPSDAQVSELSSGDETRETELPAIPEVDKAGPIVEETDRAKPFIESHVGGESPPSLPEIKPVTAAADSPQLLTTSASEAQRQTDRPPFRSRLSAGLIVSPDLSTAGALKNFHNPGYKIGLTMEYNLTPRLAVSTGLIQSGVHYASRGTENGRYPTRTVPEELIAECLILDIPVTLKYDFLTLSRSRLFLTTGISSYIMLSEQYQFSYTSGEYSSNDPDRMESWSGKTGTGHWMSNAGLSIGYELDVHPNWSLRAEPFIRIPLKEVGWGNVRLYSVGSFFSLRYHFPS